MSNQYRPQSFSILPPVVKNLLIINGLFFLAMISLDKVYHIDLSNFLGLHYFSSEMFKPYQFITYMFMHADLNHIFFNMFALWMFGAAIENQWGGKRFLFYYFFTGIGAAILHYGIMYFELKPTLDAIDLLISKPSTEAIQAFLSSNNFRVTSIEIQDLTNVFINKYNSTLGMNQQNEALQLSVNFLSEYKTMFLNGPNVVGASGAVFGLLLAFGMLFPNSVIYIYFLIPLKAKYFVIVYGLAELYFGVTRTNSGVAHYAHLGGMLFGFILIMYWKYNRKLY
ncbi:MAG: rhomboid family intramembrane serine protease [Bacteroidota bacterium]